MDTSGHENELVCTDFMCGLFTSRILVYLTSYIDANRTKYVEFTEYDEEEGIKTSFLFDRKDEPSFISRLRWLLKERGSCIKYVEEDHCYVLRGPYLLTSENDVWVINLDTNPIHHVFYPKEDSRIQQKVPSLNDYWWIDKMIFMTDYNLKILNDFNKTLKILKIWHKKTKERKYRRELEISKVVWQYWLERALRPVEGKLYQYYEKQYRKHLLEYY